MGMLEIFSEKQGGMGKAFKDFKESLECLKEDFETLWDEMESMGERSGQGGGSYGGGGSRGGSGSYGNRYDEYDDEEMMGERRGRRSRSRRR